MQPKFFAILLILALNLGARVSLALVPPMSEAELKHEADLIVVGQVLATEKSGKAFADHCFIWQNYVSTFAVKQIPAGTSVRTLKLPYKGITGDVNPQSPCSGGDGSYWLAPGQFYKLYLQKSKSENPDEYLLFHWSGIIDWKP